MTDQNFGASSAKGNLETSVANTNYDISGLIGSGTYDSCDLIYVILIAYIIKILYS